MTIRLAAGLALLCGLAACATDTARPPAAPVTPMAVASAAGGAPEDSLPAAADLPVSMPAPAPAVPAMDDGGPRDMKPVAGAPDAALPETSKRAPVAPPRVAKPLPKPAMPPKPAPTAPAVAATPPSPPAASGRLYGRLELVATGREGIVAGEVAEGLVYFLPKSGGEPPKPGTFTVDTRSKGFLPSVLVVPVGSTIRFPNRDAILHNVFSRTPGSIFDFGYYGPGETRQRVFSKPGLVLVNCNVHHNMRLDVVVLATPYYTRPDRNGRYALDGLPKGPGTLVFWHPRADAQQVAVTLPSDAAVSRRLAATKPSRHVGMEH